MSQIYACQLSDKLIELTGADKKSYLHGQITQDINLLKEDNFLWAGHCSGKGKLWAVSKLFGFEDSYLNILSSEELSASLPELKKYAVFAKVTIAETTEYQLYGLFGDDLQPALDQMEIEFVGNAATFSYGKALKLSEQRVILCLSKTLPESLTSLFTWREDDSEWQSLSIKDGEPRLNHTAVGEYVPQMVNLQAIGGISFTKGCYTGQETVARMKYLGKNKRAMFVLSAPGQTASLAEEIEQQVSENWRRAGKVIASAYHAPSDTSYLLAVMPNDLEQDAALRSKQESPERVTIEPLPYTLSDN